MYMCMSIYNHTSYTFTYVGLQVRIHNQSTLLVIIPNIYQMYNYLFFEFISTFGQHFTR